MHYGVQPAFGQVLPKARATFCDLSFARIIKRLPLPLDVIRTIQDECLDIDDDNRWLIAMIADIGMRLSEAVGLMVDASS